MFDEVLTESLCISPQSELAMPGSREAWERGSATLHYYLGWGTSLRQYHCQQQ